MSVGRKRVQAIPRSSDRAAITLSASARRSATSRSRRLGELAFVNRLVEPKATTRLISHAGSSPRIGGSSQSGAVWKRYRAIPSGAPRPVPISRALHSTPAVGGRTDRLNARTARPRSRSFSRRQVPTRLEAPVTSARASGGTGHGSPHDRPGGETGEAQPHAEDHEPVEGERVAVAEELPVEADHPPVHVPEHAHGAVPARAALDVDGDGRGHEQDLEARAPISLA